MCSGWQQLQGPGLDDEEAAKATEGACCTGPSCLRLQVQHWLCPEQEALGTATCSGAGRAELTVLSQPPLAIPLHASGLIHRQAGNILF